MFKMGCPDLQLAIPDYFIRSATLLLAIAILYFTNSSNVIHAQTLIIATESGGTPWIINYEKFRADVPLIYLNNVADIQTSNTLTESTNKSRLRADEVLKAAMKLRCCDFPSISRSRHLDLKTYREIDEKLEKCLERVMSNEGNRKQLDACFAIAKQEADKK